MNTLAYIKLNKPKGEELDHVKRNAWLFVRAEEGENQDIAIARMKLFSSVCEADGFHIIGESVFIGNETGAKHILKSYMVRCINSDETINLESYRIENEIRHMIDGRQLNKSEIRRKLIEATAIHYANLDTKKYEIQRLKCILKNQNRPNGFPLELFNLAAETISFDEDDQIVLKLINGQIIRKEHAYAAN